MQRKITGSIRAWKESHRKPLVIFGARQTGKTTSVLDFASGEYDAVVHVDFYRQPQLKAAFQGSLEPSAVVSALSALLGFDIPAEGTLLFLDEIQDCDQAITALKYFATEAPQYDVVCAGSLLGVHVARTGSFPVGYVDMLTMHPMDFEEFCWALGERRAFEMARASWESGSPCVLHDHLMALYREYLLVGGMPEAVGSYADRRSLPTVSRIQESVRVAYVADMAKYTTGTDAAKVVACWDSLPSQLAKEGGSTKFQWKLVARGAKAERYEGAVDWLVASGIVSRCTQVTDGVSPLKSFENPGSFKLYVADTGLLANAYGATPSDFEGKDHRSARFRGGIAENYVMQQLVAAGVRPFYWGVQSRGEVEFVVGRKGEVIPIEVKSGEHVSSASLGRFAEKYGCEEQVRVSARNFGLSGGMRSVPLYAAALLAEWLAG